MEKTIILKLSGPLQSWGISSNFETRDTARYPSKSAIIGMVGAALGYRRDETEKIQELNELSFGVRIEQRGSLLKDYHIAKSTKQSYVTNRYYLQDAVFLVMLSHKEPSRVDEIVNALTHPIFPLYMGRRSNPVTYDFMLDIVENDLLSIIRDYDWQASEWYKKKFNQKNKCNTVLLDVYLDAHLLDDEKSPMYHSDKAESFDVVNRKHGFRRVKAMQTELKIKSNTQETEHDVFQEIGGS